MNPMCCRLLVTVLFWTGCLAAGSTHAGAPATVAAAQRPPYWRERTTQFEAFSAPADVVMLGDSLTDGAEWAEIFPEQRIVNRGIDADTADGVRARLGSVLAVRPKVVFLMIGINDFADPQRSVDAVFADVRAVVMQLQAGGAAVVVQSTLPCQEQLGAWKFCAAINGRVRALNLRLATLASRRVHWVDLASVLTTTDGVKREYTFDGVHLNGAGYRRWHDAIAPLMPAGRRRP